MDNFTGGVSAITRTTKEYLLPSPSSKRVGKGFELKGEQTDSMDNTE